MKKVIKILKSPSQRRQRKRQSWPQRGYGRCKKKRSGCKRGNSRWLSSGNFGLTTSRRAARIDLLASASNALVQKLRVVLQVVCLWPLHGSTISAFTSLYSWLNVYVDPIDVSAQNVALYHIFVVYNCLLARE
uniref:Uncharacterized protein n=1 Tax=Leersia perrieri TaxID=77586 RepID=A0A0D9XKY7_9ORYZ